VQQVQPMPQQVQPEQRTQLARQIQRAQRMQSQELQPVLQRASQPRLRRLGNP
jgi:hypothetical protein